jgi:hypothetical protein
MDASPIAAVIRSKDELRRAMIEHTRCYPHGDWSQANERIERARGIADATLCNIGRWPSGKRYLGNDAVLALLEEVAASGLAGA